MQPHLDNPITQTFLRGKLGEVLFNQRHFGVAMYTQNTGTYWVNNRYAQILGYPTTEDLREEGVNHRLHPDDEPLYNEMIDRLLHKTLSHFTIDARWRCQDGTYQDAVMSAIKITEDFLPEPVVVFILEKLGGTRHRAVTKAKVMFAC